MKAEDFWNEVDKDLGFEEFPSSTEEDWGVINADPNRTASSSNTSWIIIIWHPRTIETSSST